MVPRERRSLIWCDVTFAVFCGLVAAIRLFVLVHPRAPAGIDSGNWLALGHDMVGPQQRSGSIVYPPLVPLAVITSVRALGLTLGVGVVTVVAALLPGVGIYVVLRLEGQGWRAPVLAGLIVTGLATGEAAAWGGFPQLIGLGLLPLFLWCLDRHVSGGGVGSIAGASVLFALLSATSHFITILAACSAVVLVVIRVVQNRRAEPVVLRRALLGSLLVPLLSLPFLPVYRTLLTASLGNGGGVDPLQLDTANLLANLDFLYRDFALFWRLALTLALVTPIVLSHRRRTRLWALTTSMLAGTMAVALVTREPRTLYALPLPAMLAIAAWMTEVSGHPHLGRLRKGLDGLLIGALAIQSVLGLHFFRLQRDYYGVVSPETVGAFDWLDDNTASDATIAVTTGAHDLILGWWVEGAVGRRTVFDAESHWLTFEDERVRARSALALFSTPFPNEDSLPTARAKGIRYILVAKTWRGYSAPAMEAFQTPTRRPMRTRTRPSSSCASRSLDDLRAESPPPTTPSLRISAPAAPGPGARGWGAERSPVPPHRIWDMGRALRNGIALLCAVLLLGAGCSDDDSTSAGGGSSTTGASTVPGATSSTGPGVSSSVPGGTTVPGGSDTTAPPSTSDDGTAPGGAVYAESGGWRLGVFAPTSGARIGTVTTLCYEVTGDSREPVVELEAALLPRSSSGLDPVTVEGATGRGSARVDLTGAAAGRYDFRVQLIVNSERLDGAAVTFPVTLADGVPEAACP